jgi:hypothetical protein
MQVEKPVPIPDPVDEHHGHDGDVEGELHCGAVILIREQARPLAGRWRRSRERGVDVTRGLAASLAPGASSNCPFG